MTTSKHRQSAFKIAILTPYIGPLPAWALLSLITCKYNLDIDWFYFVDRETRMPEAENIRYIKTSLSDLKALIARRTGLEPNIESGYKLCDFKPTYGLIFEEWIRGYDFWGHADLDVIWGSIRKFLTDDILSQFDMITCHPYNMTGFFSLYRNSQTVNQMFKNVEGYEEVFRRSQNLCFDETGMDMVHKGGMTKAARDYEKRGKIKIYSAAPIAEEAEEFRRRWDLHLVRFFNASLPDLQQCHFGPCYWSEGRLYVKKTGAEIMAHHFPQTKQRLIFSPLFWRNDFVAFTVSLRGFVFEYSGLAGPLFSLIQNIACFFDSLLYAFKILMKRIKKFLILTVHKTGYWCFRLFGRSR